MKIITFILFYAAILLWIGMGIIIKIAPMLR